MPEATLKLSSPVSWGPLPALLLTLLQGQIPGGKILATQTKCQRSSPTRKCPEAPWELGAVRPCVRSWCDSPLLLVSQKATSQLCGGSRLHNGPTAATKGSREPGGL